MDIEVDDRDARDIVTGPGIERRNGGTKKVGASGSLGSTL